MATGRRAFQKKTAIDTLAAILNDEPESIARLNPQTPTPLRWIAERCLAKEPEGRYASTRDLARELTGIRDHLSEATSGFLAAPERPRRRPKWVTSGAAVALLAAGVLAQRSWGGRSNAATVPGFKQLTFRRGNLLSARFSPDGKTVVYSGAYDGAPAEIFTVRTDSVVSSPIGVRADVMGVSSKGELAVLLHKLFVSVPGGTGTLARVPIGGGTPRELLENVYRADWAPNGEDLAVVRDLGNAGYQVEYPIGTVLYKSVSGDPRVRVSPNGEYVAFGDGVSISTIDRRGNRRVLSSGWADLFPFAWAPGGQEIVFSAHRVQGAHAIYAVSLSGKERIVMSNAFGLWLHDVAPDGRLLLEDGRERGSISFLARGATREKDIGRTTNPLVHAISADGGEFVYHEDVDPGGVHLQRTDGTPSVRLGTGELIADLSPDGRFVLVLDRDPSPHLTLIPTGPGSPKPVPLELGGLDLQGAGFLPKDKGLVLSLRSPANGDYAQAVVGLEGGKPRVFHAERYADRSFVPSPDGERLAYQTTDRHVQILAFADGRSTRVPGDAVGETTEIITWSEDGLSLYLAHYGSVPVQIDRLELATGRTEIWKKLIPDDPVAVGNVWNVVIAPDGRSYAYSYIRGFIDDLYVVEGVR